MTLNELQEKLQEDLRIDPSNLMHETSDNLRKHSWYFGELITHRAMYKKAVMDVSVVEKDRYNYYAGIGKEVFDYNLDRTAIKYNLEGDSILLDARKKLAMIELKIEFLVKACDLLKDRGFAIKNQIDLLKFQSGG